MNIVKLKLKTISKGQIMFLMTTIFVSLFFSPSILSFKTATGSDNNQEMAVGGFLSSYLKKERSLH